MSSPSRSVFIQQALHIFVYFDNVRLGRVYGINNHPSD